jgi:hypothetical protein
MSLRRWRALLVLLAAFWVESALSGCDLQKMEEAQRAAIAASSSPSSPTPTPSCGDFSEYDTYADCVHTTSANCNSQWQTFSNGGAALCYFPVDGWQGCTPTSADWIYTPYTATVCKVGATAVYWKARSVIGCSSAVCACQNVQQVVDTCTLGVDCPVPTPSPMPACP